MRTFHLQRQTDVTGVSGTGKVAEGVEFSNGKVAVQWVVGEHQSTVVWESAEAVEAIHGHNGATVIVWDDQTTLDLINFQEWLDDGFHDHNISGEATYEDIARIFLSDRHGV